MTANITHLSLESGWGQPQPHCHCHSLWSSPLLALSPCLRSGSPSERERIRSGNASSASFYVATYLQMPYGVGRTLSQGLMTRWFEEAVHRPRLGEYGYCFSSLLWSRSQGQQNQKTVFSRCYHGHWLSTHEHLGQWTSWASSQGSFCFIKLPVRWTRYICLLCFLRGTVSCQRKRRGWSQRWGAWALGLEKIGCDVGFFPSSLRGCEWVPETWSLSRLI